MLRPVFPKVMSVAQGRTPNLVLVEVGEKRNRLDGFSETHFIGQNTVEAVLKESLWRGAPWMSEDLAAGWCVGDFGPCCIMEQTDLHPGDTSELILSHSAARHELGLLHVSLGRIVGAHRLLFCVLLGALLGFLGLRTKENGRRKC
jgi:hypothetical protein